MRFAIALAILVIAISGFRSRLSGRLQNPKTLTRTFSSTQKYNTRTTPSPTSPTFISPLPIETLPESFIRERTFSCLDFDVILNVLTNNTLTIRGKDIAKERVGQTSDEITKDYAMVEQILGQITFLPLRSSMNVWPVLRSLEQNLSPPEKDDLAQFGRYIEEIVELKDFMIFFKDQLSLFDAVTTNMTLPMEFSSMFVNSFDDDDELNAEKYPTIKKLRQQRETLRSKIIQTIQTILKSIDMQDKLAAESGYQEIDGRYCIMLKNTYKKGLGVVHGSSNTGRSFYVEPYEVVEPTNEMKDIQAQLKAEETQIFYDMCRSISNHRTEIKRSIEAVAEVDVYRAKAKIGVLIKGVIPEVGDAGVIRCVDARHPVLSLRGVNPIGNDLLLDDNSTAWVISGPNAGGKTIILKMAGLFGLMARYSIPIPARRGARVDLMDVLADIGDMQTVSGDLSTFSGHLVVCREMLKQVQRNSKGKFSLVLLDEIGTGTDPAQGAALAQAVLEELVAQRTRVIVTTHYQRIKELAAEDSRFRIAAMEFVDNKPTYKLRLGSVGESFALEAAQRMHLPSSVLIRANALLDDETRRIVALQQRLEEETNRARVRQREFEDLTQQLEQRELDLEKSRADLQEKITKLRDGVTEEFVRDLKQRERDLEAMLQEAKEAIFDTKASETQRAKIAEQTKQVIKSTRLDVEKVLVETRAEDLATPLEPGEKVEIGKILVVLEKGNLFGVNGVVSQKDKGRGRIVLSVAGMEVKVERHLLGYPHRSGPLGMKAKDLFMLAGSGGLDDSSDAMKNISSKDRRMLKMLQEELVDPDKMLSKHNAVKSNSKLSGLKIASNTVDLRGKNLVEAQAAAMQYFERLFDKVNAATATGVMTVVYFHIGNPKGTEDIKPKFRTWLKGLPLVYRAIPADSTDGGDAFTIVELNLKS